jgi:DNA-directed RNA polymerase specialized sigma24 family protein
MDAWVSELQRGNSDAAWDAFLDRYRRLIFAAIRHYARDYDDVMDIFARVCESLRADDLRRLRSWTDQTEHRAHFSTWLVTVVRNLTVDWFRLRDGRHRVSAIAERMPPRQRAIFERVFVEGRSHLETYELLRAAGFPTLSFKEFLVELRQTYALATTGRRGHLFSDVSPPPPDEIEIDDGAGEDGELLADALRSLSPTDRVAVEMYVVDQLPADEVARIVGLPNAKAVYNRVYRALATLRERLERAGLRRGGR